MVKMLVGAMLCAIAVSGEAMALCPTYPYTLTNGTTAEASQVMANFHCAALTSGATIDTATLTGNTALPGSGKISSGGLLGLGMTPSHIVDITNTQNGGAVVKLLNASAGSAARSFFYAHNGTSGGTFQHTGTGYVPSSMYKTDATLVLGNGSGGLTVGSTTAAPVSIAYNNVVVMQVDGTGVGIGTLSPSYLLTVNGTAYASGAAGALSDARHKMGVVSLEDGALSQVMRLRPISFSWKDPKDSGMKGRQTGFIAQEVEKILPSVVLTQNDSENTKDLKYNELVVILTKAVQEQQVHIASLEVKVKALERRSEIHTAQR